MRRWHAAVGCARLQTPRQRWRGQGGRREAHRMHMQVVHMTHWLIRSSGGRHTPLQWVVVDATANGQCVEAWYGRRRGGPGEQRLITVQACCCFMRPGAPCHQRRTASAQRHTALGRGLRGPRPGAPGRGLWTRGAMPGAAPVPWQRRSRRPAVIVNSPPLIFFGNSQGDGRLGGACSGCEARARTAMVRGLISGLVWARRDLRGLVARGTFTPKSNALS